MDFTALKARVALQLSNMQSNHPFYGEIDAAVNDAVREVVKRTVLVHRQNFNLFDELQRKVNEITVLNQAWLAIPDDMLTLQRVFSFDSDDVPAESDDRTYPVRFIAPDVYEYLDKGTNVTGYPRLVTQIANRFYLWPTPRTGYLSYIRAHYIRRESDMSAGTDTPTLREQWHRAVTDYACYTMETAMLHPERAAMWLRACDEKITNVVDLVAYRDGQTDRQVVPYDLPTQGEING